MYKILLVDDHPVVRQGLKLLLEDESNLQIIAEATTGEEAVVYAEKYKPDIIVMDIAMPQMNGLLATEKIKSIFPSIKIILLSAYADDGYIQKALFLNVDGFLVKQCSPDLLLIALNEIIKNNKFYSPEILSRINARNFHSHSLGEGIYKKYTEVSPREKQVLQQIAEGSSNKLIAYSLQISIKTVEKHRQNLMSKLNIHDVAGLTRYAITEGMIRCHTGKPLKSSL